MYALLEPTVYVLFLIACFAIVYGFLLGGAQDAKKASEKSDEDEENENEDVEDHISMKKAVLMPVIGSLALLVLFFFLDVMYYVLLVLFAVIGSVSVAVFVFPFVSFVYGKVRGRRAYVKVNESEEPNIDSMDSMEPKVDSMDSMEPKVDSVTIDRENPMNPADSGSKLVVNSAGIRFGHFVEFSWLEVVSFCIGAAVVVLWLVTSNWLPIDFIAFAIATVALSTLKIPSTRICVVLLSLFFAYDVFWVFLSGYIFSSDSGTPGEGVMVTVAKALPQLPMLLIIPHVFGDSGFSMLGLGDILIPGLFIGFLYRMEKMQGRAGLSGFRHVSASMIAYFCALLLAFVAVVESGLGQPALMYIVPALFLVNFSLAFAAKNLGEFWRFDTRQTLVAVDSAV